MRSRKRNLDGTKHKPADSKTPRAKRVKKTGKTKKQITCKKRTIVKKRSDTQEPATTNLSTAEIKKSKKGQKVFFGLDLHKKFPQVAAVDQEGNLLMNKRVENDFGIIEQEFSASQKMPNTCWSHHLCGMAYTENLQEIRALTWSCQTLSYAPHSKIQKEDQQV